jgi:hypothetical protein
MQTDGTERAVKGESGIQLAWLDRFVIVACPIRSLT